MVEWGSLGRLKPDDIPAAAVDFHISSIVDDLLGKPNILAVAAAAAAKTGSDPAGVIQRAMWHFSGSCNHRSPLQVLPVTVQSTCCQVVEQSSVQKLSAEANRYCPTVRQPRAPLLLTSPKVPCSMPSGVL